MTGNDAEQPAGVWDDDRGIAATLSDGVAVLGELGQVVWANEALARLLDLPLGDLLGADGFALVHPDEQARAFDGVAYSAQFPERTSVAPYRLRTGRGDWVDVELKSAMLERPDGTYLVLVVRDGTNRRTINRALRGVANGDGLDSVATVLIEAVMARWPGTAVAISSVEPDGQRHVVAVGLPADLIEHERHDRQSPVDIGEVVVIERSEMPAPIAASAERCGFECRAVAVVADPLGEPATLSVWYDHTAIARLEFTHAADELAEVLALGLDRRHHLWQLHHIAHHDSLTGLLNRAGFLEQFQFATAAARSGTETVVVLYLDLDGLKSANDVGGHASGDRVLIEVARRLRDAVGGEAVIGRIGGDEFVVAITVDDDPIAAGATAAQRVVDAMRFPVPGETSNVAGRLMVAASVGIAVDDPASDPERTLDRADAAMYRAKSTGKSRWAV